MCFHMACLIFFFLGIIALCLIFNKDLGSSSLKHEIFLNVQYPLLIYFFFYHLIYLANSVELINISDTSRSLVLWPF